VQQTANDAKYEAQEKAPEVRAKLDETVSSVRQKVSGSSNDSSTQP
jgi:hypothetical protein